MLAADLDETRLEELGEPEGSAGRIEGFVVNAGDSGAAGRMVDETLHRFGRLDGIVNCAAVNRRQPIADVDAESIDWIINVNLKMPILLTQAGAAAMPDGGSIVHISSTNGRFGLESTGVYAVTKAGLDQLARTTAVELAPTGVRVNCIAPGFLMTPLSRPLWEDDAKRRWILDRVPVERPGHPQELLGACLLLCSDAGRFITGTTITADGGFLAGNSWLEDAAVTD